MLWSTILLDPYIAWRHQGDVTFPPGAPSYMSMPVPSVPASSIALWVFPLSSARDRIFEPQKFINQPTIFCSVSVSDACPKTNFNSFTSDITHSNNYPSQRLYRIICIRSHLKQLKSLSLRNLVGDIMRVDTMRVNTKPTSTQRDPLKLPNMSPIQLRMLQLTLNT